MKKRLTMGNLFKLLERINHTPQQGLNAKIHMKENVVVKLGQKSTV